MPPIRRQSAGGYSGRKRQRQGLVARLPHPREGRIGRTVTAKGADPDTLVASAKAYLAALNKLVARAQRSGRLEPLAVPERRIHSTDVG